jgi:iron complex transport system substrate-binding protein
VNVVTLLPSATEIVCALGRESWLRGRSHECDFPPSVRQLPVLTAPQLPADAPSGEIDRAVKSLLSRALSIYKVDAERLASLAPDLIVTQSQCDVCAVSEADVIHALAEVAGGAPRIVSLAPKNLEDVLDDLGRVGAALDAREAAASLVAGLRARIAAVSARVPSGPRPRVACIEWLDPPMGAGNWVPELVALAGGEPLFGEAGAHSRWLEWDALVAADPDLIVLMPCGFDLARTRAEAPALTARAGWSELSAVRAGRVFVADGNQYFNRPGPRLIDSLELLLEALHGVPSGHAGLERLA